MVLRKRPTVLEICGLAGLVFGLTSFVVAILAGPVTRTGSLSGMRPDAVQAEEVGAEKSNSAKSAVEPSSEETDAYETLTLRGQVRYLGPTLKQRYGIETVPESAERQIVLDVPGGELVPIVEDIRRRAFRADERLRGIDVELLVRRYKGTPFVQVIRLLAVKDDGLFVIDYWCDVCAIAMYELKSCDCCQAPNRLRERRVTADGIADEEQ